MNSENGFVDLIELKVKIEPYRPGCASYSNKNGRVESSQENRKRLACSVCLETIDSEEPNATIFIFLKCITDSVNFLVYYIISTTKIKVSIMQYCTYIGRFSSVLFAIESIIQFPILIFSNSNRFLYLFFVLSTN